MLSSKFPEWRLAGLILRLERKSPGPVRLRFIRRCRDLGFTLDQVRDLLRLSSQEDQPCAEVNRISAEHLTEIERKVADLTRLADERRRINGRVRATA
jgi:DNA-binding transcriptional MerR regulator